MLSPTEVHTILMIQKQTVPSGTLLSMIRRALTVGAVVMAPGWEQRSDSDLTAGVAGRGRGQATGRRGFACWLYDGAWVRCGQPRVAGQAAEPGFRRDPDGGGLRPRCLQRRAPDPAPGDRPPVDQP